MTLAACSSEKQISFEKAKEIANQIKNNDSKDSFMFTMSNVGAIGKGEDRITVNLSYKYIYTEKGYYTYILGNDGDHKFDSEMYCVYNTKHGDVTISINVITLSGPGKFIRISIF